MTFYETMTVAKEHGIDDIELSIACSVHQVYGGDIDTSEFNEACDLVYSAWLKSDVDIPFDKLAHAVYLLHNEKGVRYQDMTKRAIYKSIFGF